MDRRTFLAAPLLFGLPALFAQERKAPSWYADALRRMKETDRYGIILVLPDIRTDGRTYGLALKQLLEGGDRGPHELFVEAVFVCLRRSQAEGLVCEPGDRHTRFLLDPSGKKIDSDLAGFGVYESAAAFTRSFGPFLHGKSDERLREHSARVERDLSAGARRAIKALDADDVEIRDQASSLLLAQTDRIAPHLVDLSRRADTPERRNRLSDLLENYFRSRPEEKPGPRLPYGCAITRFVSTGCGSYWEDEPRELPACGMGRANPDSRRLLTFLKE